MSAPTFQSAPPRPLSDPLPSEPAAAETVISLAALATPRPSPVLARRHPQRFPFGWLAAVVVGVCLIGVAVWYGPGWVNGNSSGKMPLTAKVTQGDFKIVVTERGELESIDSIQVMCTLEGGGKLVSILPEGTTVEKDTEVAKLDTDALVKVITEQEIKWEAAESKVNSSRSELSLAKNKAKSEIAKAELLLFSAESDLKAFAHPKGKYKGLLDKAKGSLETARKNLNESEDSLEFTRGLVKKGFAPLDQVRTIEFAVQERRLAMTGAESDLYILENFTREKDQTELVSKANEAKLELARTKETQDTAIGKAEADLKSATKTAEIEKKQLERLRKQIDQCIVKAPAKGIVIYTHNRYDENSRIRAGATVFFQQPIFTLPDLSRMLVKMKVHESMIKKVKVGQPATLQIDALPNRTLNGKVLKIGTLPQSDGWRGGSVKQYETEISIDDLPADAGLKPGMTAEVKILINVIADARTVPVQAVAEYEGSSIVYVVGSSGIERKVVTVGESNDQYIQITDGLEAGESVALDARVRAASELKAAGPQGAKPADVPAPSASKADPK